ncbi:TonB-dependent receptor [Vibrio europaeus]|uniref:Vitamin B12 transporter BtuB n=1 Tax=Vibrio europaeus TaxID=300876 RepID=A0A178J914_9VIBR|nr:TonB-dependent receptor [Vibrio europaeus]MDC5703196.1 TonB-dependent receptor [Vibrio europaeus]MDC5707831.1 TonB-dependent receptor [Vibrio europaeus]MDC5713297.1 TonB-dependent receptor [Vibrio europaeus]MDC5719140.1 TonB-dependent receptor [Vibrio europaeus]MDC5723068.1 TonB-dependent receptor [Vibrio europaeus]
MNRSILAIAVASLLPHASLSYAQEASSDETMVVTANRFEQSADSVLAPVSVVTREDIEKMQAQSALDVLKTLPGVELSYQGTKANTNSIFIRGTSSRHTLVLVDGVRINSATAGGASVGLIPVNAIEKIEVVRGPRAAVYGSDALGGVISITTKPKSGSVHEAKATFGSNSYAQQSWRSVGDISEKTKGSFFVNNEKSKGYKVSSSAPDSDRHGFDAQTILGSLTHTYSSSVELFFTGYYQQGLVEYAGFSSKSESDRENYTFAGGVNYSSENWLSQLQLSTDKGYSADGKADGGASGKASITTKRNSASWVNTYTGLENSAINLGVDYYQEKAQRGGTNTSDYSDNKKTNTGVFITGFTQLSDLTLEASLRNDRDSAFGNHTTWNLGAGYSLTEAIELVGSYGTAFKAPTFNDLYYPTSGNPDLKPETSKSLEFGVKGYHELVDWSVTTYRTDIEDMIAWAPIAPGSSVYKPSNVENAQIKGIELELGFETGPINHKLIGDWKDPKDTKKNTQLIRRAKENYKWVGTYSADAVDVSLIANYVGKRYDSSLYELEAYSTADAAVTYRVTDKFTTGLRVSNMFDKGYETAKGYPAAEREWYLNASYQF